MVPNCANCGRPNGILLVGESEETSVPICIDCYEKLQSINLKTAHFHQYMAWEAEQQINDQFEGFGVPVFRRPPPPAPTLRNASHTINNISVSGGQVGSINTGNVGSLTLQVSQMQQEGRSDLASALNELVSAVLASSEFTAAIKNEVIELLEPLAVEANQSPDRRKPAVIRALMNRLSQMLADGSTVGKLWERVAELFGSLF